MTIQGTAPVAVSPFGQSSNTDSRIKAIDKQIESIRKNRFVNLQS